MCGLSHTLGKMFSKAKLSVYVHHLLADDVSCHVNSPGTPHFFIDIMSDGEHLYSDIMSPILLMPITVFSLSIYCRMSKQSHTLGNTFSKAELSVEVHHLFYISQLIYDGEHLYLTHFAYAHYYLLCVYLAQDEQTVSHSWQNVRQSRALC